MNRIFIFQKTVLNTVFFFVVITIIAGCESAKYDNTSEIERFLPNKYYVKYKINTKSYTDKYYKGINTIFFPLLKLKANGNILENYSQEKTMIDDFVILSSTYNKLSLLSNVAKNFKKDLGFQKSSYISKLPVNLDRENSYFIKTYFLNKDTEEDYNFLYVKISIDLFDTHNEIQPSKNVWIGEGNFAYDKYIDMETVLETSMNVLIKYSFLNKEKDGNIYLLNN